LVVSGHTFIRSLLEEQIVVQEPESRLRVEQPFLRRRRFSSNTRHLALCTFVLLFCAYLRFSNLDWGTGHKWGGHPDESIVLGVIRGLSSNHFDTDLARAPILPALQNSRYNFSSYEYCTYVWYSAMRAAQKLLNSLVPTFVRSEPVVIDRMFSACLGLLACLLTYECAKILLGPSFALLAMLFTGVLPLLVQDSHYARAEALVTAGTLAVFYLTLRLLAKPSYKLCFWCAFLLGFLIASKVSLGALVYLPLCATWMALRAQHRDNLLTMAEHAAVTITGGIAGFLLGVPYILVNLHGWWAGWRSLRDQYSHPFPPHGPDPEGYCFGFIANYFWRTFGAALIILAVIGIIYFVRRKQYVSAFFVSSPLVFCYAIFGMEESFFERNMSHVVPLLAILAAAGCAEIWDLLKRPVVPRDLRIAAMGLTIILALWIPLSISWFFAVTVLSGKLYEEAGYYDALTQDTHKGMPFYADNLFDRQSLKRIQEKTIANPNGFVLRLDDANDAISRRRLALAEHIFHMKLLAQLPGHFADLPTCTLQIYHSKSYAWYFVQP
jgi:Dolichyl-phosphate-mannose-protein mannosyltransferase